MYRQISTQYRSTYELKNGIKIIFYKSNSTNLTTDEQRRKQSSQIATLLNVKPVLPFCSGSRNIKLMDRIKTTHLQMASGLPVLKLCDVTTKYHQESSSMPGILVKYGLILSHKYFEIKHWAAAFSTTACQVNK